MAIDFINDTYFLKMADILMFYVPWTSVYSVLKSYVYIDMKIELLLLKTLWMIDKFITIQMYMWFRVVHVYLNF